jgi:hypothetical protein
LKLLNHISGHKAYNRWTYLSEKTDLLQGALGFRLLALRQLVQHVGGLVYPESLAAGLGPHFLDRLPQAERAVGDRELGRHRKSAPLQVEQRFLPGLRPTVVADSPAAILLGAAVETSSAANHQSARISSVLDWRGTAEGSTATAINFFANCKRPLRYARVALTGLITWELLGS